MTAPIERWLRAEPTSTLRELAADASEEHATHGVFLALERGILTKERQKKLIRWAAEWARGEAR